MDRVGLRSLIGKILFDEETKTKQNKKQKNPFWTCLISSVDSDPSSFGVAFDEIKKRERRRRRR